jgi:alkanesulfonate monooxygenase SsuD/methylene tetrahydromethanopterin reductase-like flavin-dependent oxidoreductase (luciferase family)
VEPVKGSALGQFWRTEKAFLAPKPGQRRPFLVNAASSGAGLDYAAKHSDLIFITSPRGLIRSRPARPSQRTTPRSKTSPTDTGAR